VPVKKVLNDVMTPKTPKAILTESFLNAIAENYSYIFWPKMLITEHQMSQLIKITHLAGRMFAEVKDFPKFEEWIVRYMKHNIDQGDPFIHVSKKLVSLGKGTGFGELALMSSGPRMASIRTLSSTSLASMSRLDFAIVLKKAVKRK
jgi:hypothetical protein